LKKKLIILLHGPLSIRECETFGISFLKKNFNLSIVEIGPLINSSHYKYKRNYNFRIIQNFKELENLFKKNMHAMCIETGFSFNSLRIFYLLKRYNIKIISIDGIASQPTPKLKNIFIKKFKWRLQLLFKNPLTFLDRLYFAFLAELRKYVQRRADIALIGGNAYTGYQNNQNIKKKIFCSSLDYGSYLKRKDEKFSFNKEYAVFIDGYIPFHPEHESHMNEFINPKKYFDSLLDFFQNFKKTTGLEILVALYPKADLDKYPSEFKKLKIVSGKISSLIKNSKLVFHHGSTAQSYAVIYKKPIIYLTTDNLEKIRYIHDNERYIPFVGSKKINIDKNNFHFLSNKNQIFSYNKKKYQSYLKNFLKHDLSKNIPWYEALKEQTEKGL
tara:strand:+ start:755 stop:1912 length:1158 start_codon:yes stop_codon:yes gene_type:complete